MYEFGRAKNSAKDDSQDSVKVNLNEIPFNAYPSVHQWLVGSTLEERLNHPSIPQMRAEYMPLSTYLVKFILEQSNFNKMYQSEFALKEGVLAHYLN
jgi:exopolyphosphatase/guanosine-5'-triphosphate,3'-diphosphate pyrophosphatase